jgi:hypothetical protein
MKHVKLFEDFLNSSLVEKLNEGENSPSAKELDELEKAAQKIYEMMYKFTKDYVGQWRHPHGYTEIPDAEGYKLSFDIDIAKAEGNDALVDKLKKQNEQKRNSDAATMKTQDNYMKNVYDPFYQEMKNKLSSAIAALGNFESYGWEHFVDKNTNFLLLVQRLAEDQAEIDRIEPVIALCNRYRKILPDGDPYPWPQTPKERCEGILKKFEEKTKKNERSVKIMESEMKRGLAKIKELKKLADD